MSKSCLGMPMCGTSIGPRHVPTCPLWRPEIPACDKCGSTDCPRLAMHPGCIARDDRINAGVPTVAYALLICERAAHTRTRAELEATRGQAAWQGTPPTVEHVRACRWWWVRGVDGRMDPEPGRFRVRTFDEDAAWVEVECGDEWYTPEQGFADVRGCEFLPCVPTIPSPLPEDVRAAAALVLRDREIGNHQPWPAVLLARYVQSLAGGAKETDK